MKKARVWFFSVFFLVSAFLLSSCAVSLRYSSSGIDKAEFGPKPPRIVAVDLIDVRPNNTFLIVNKDLKKDIENLRKAVREHMAKAGMALSIEDVMAAPTSVEQVEEIFKTAEKQGADAVLFLRLNNINFHGQPKTFVTVVNIIGIILAPVGGIGLLPIIVVNSVPVNEEGAHAVVEAVVIEPKTRLVLGRFVGQEDYDDKVTGWSHNPPAKLPDIIKKAIQKAVAAVADSAKAGFPGRTEAADLKTILAPADTIQFHSISK
jgi:hypothetical protein